MICATSLNSLISSRSLKDIKNIDLLFSQLLHSEIEHRGIFHWTNSWWMFSWNGLNILLKCVESFSNSFLSFSSSINIAHPRNETWIPIRADKSWPIESFFPDFIFLSNLNETQLFNFNATQTVNFNATQTFNFNEFSKPFKCFQHHLLIECV